MRQLMTSIALVLAIVLLHEQALGSPLRAIVRAGDTLYVSGQVA